MRTSETVTDLGLYITKCCGQELIFDAGDTFQRCPKCHALSDWELEDEVIPLEPLERENGVAA